MTTEHIIKILKIDFITHNVKRFTLEKPEGYIFNPGQATNISINKEELGTQKRPFTFTSIPKDLVLEIIIKKYPNGITEKMHMLKSGDELILDDAFGYFNYKGEGVFIAGGTGITPFLSIFRNIENEEINKNKLIFSNKSHKDIICERELTEMFGENASFILTDEKRKGYLSKRINNSFLKKEITDFNKYFYVCGPPSFVDSIKKSLIKLGANEEKIIVG